ncbi:MAG: lipocalin-like domain-containing protein [Thermomicrobiales bacterium]
MHPRQFIHREILGGSRLSSLPFRNREAGWKARYHLKAKLRRSFPVFFITLLIVLTACGGSGTAESFPTPNPQVGAVATPASTPGPVPGTIVQFPTDEAPHPVLTEWWYYTGDVRTADGAHYGIEYVIFQGSRADFPIGYAAHFAVIDPQTGAFSYDEAASLARTVAFGGTGGFDLRVNDWTMRGLGGTDHLHAAMQSGAYAIDLTVTDAKGPVLQGGGQFSYGAGGSSYYYSRTRMRPSGTITVGGTAKPIVDGTLWFDHQWGNFLATNGGWDWFSTRLDDNSEMMIYNLRDASGTILQTFGEYVPPCPRDCSPTQPVPAIALSQDQFSITALGTWTSPTTGITYPSTWRVTVTAKGDVPTMDLIYTPVIPNAELDTRHSTSVIYWEGDCTITGTKAGGPITGSGYVELTGYDKGK